jgi:hypothetical protein
LSTESYTLRQVAELLGLTRRALQQRIHAGAFPGRFLAMGPDGPEMHVPARDVEQLLEAHRGRNRDWVEATQVDQQVRSLPPGQVSLIGPRDDDEGFLRLGEGDLEVASSPVYPSPLAEFDLEALRAWVLAAVREERETLVASLRDIIQARDHEVGRLRDEVVALRRVMEQTASGVRAMEVREAQRAARLKEERAGWAELFARTEPQLDLEPIERELDALETMLAALQRG